MNSDPLQVFFDGFDDLRGVRTSTGPLRAALASGGAETVEDLVRYGNLRVPQFSLLGATMAVPTVTRRVTGRPRGGYAAPVAIEDALHAGAVLRVERPDLRWPELAEGLAELTGPLEVGRLAVYALHFDDRAQRLRFDCAAARFLVTQLAGTTAWWTSASPQRGVLDRGGSRQVSGEAEGGAEWCEPLTSSVLLVMCYALPDAGSVRQALAEAFLGQLGSTGEAERHHLVAVEAKAEWLHHRLDGFLTEIRLGTAGAEIDLLGPVAECAGPTVELSEGAS